MQFRVRTEMDCLAVEKSTAEFHSKYVGDALRYEVFDPDARVAVL